MRFEFTKKRVLFVTLPVVMLACNHSEKAFDSASNSDFGFDTGVNSLSVGCHIPAAHPSGGVQIQMDFGSEAGNERGFYLVIPDDYDSAESHRLIMGFSGRDWTGERTDLLGSASGQHLASNSYIS